MCQKPLTPTLGEADALLRAVGGRARLMVHENWRFRPWYREARRWIADGGIGEVQLARMSNLSSSMLPDEQGVRRALARQPFTANEHRLMIAEGLIHHLDVMRYLCGPLRVVAARTHRSLADIRGETFAAVFLETSAGRPVEVTGSNAAPGYPARSGDRLEIVGTRASLTFEDGRLQLLGPERRQALFDVEAGYQHSFDAAIGHFVACLRSGAPFETDAVDNLETLRLVEHAYLAAGQHPPAGSAP
ncbi:MAG TPA: Gfo/Idh/MocA family oxidoreductase [Geminicoccaceae bacterium]|nr:Gfo/Idh/MocA family oxidoreductase [Geminicoccus sp.]HMU51549.1 Gfo/Idh/MocA family oxidoreductase [Geminicoccaceae bacterium]